jgi:tetratricopeptide (TPR) repeat protein
MTFVLGDVDGALAIGRDHLERAKRTGQLSEIRTALIGMTDGLYHGSTPADEALEEIERLVSLVAESPGATADLIRQRPGLYAMLGRFDEARAAAEHNLALMEQVGAGFLQAGQGFWIAPMHMLAGEYAEAERVLRANIETFESRGETGFTSTLSAELAEALLAQGRIDEARQYAERSRTLGAEDDIVTQIGWRRAMAKVLAARGSIEEAERLAREAVELANGTTYVPERGNSWMRLAEVLRMAGKNEEAAGALSRAVELYEQKRNVVSAERARRELADLGMS